MIEAVRHLAVANRGVAAGIGSQDAAQSRAASAVHDRVAWESAVQVFLYLQVPVSAGRVPPCPHLAAQLTGGPLCRPACQYCDVRDCSAGPGLVSIMHSWYAASGLTHAQL